MENSNKPDYNTLIAVRAGICAKMIAHRDRYEELAVELGNINIEIDEAAPEEPA